MPLFAPHFLSSNQAAWAGSLGLCLIFYEFNRPGRILPAACGVLLLLFSVASWVERGVRPWALGLLATAAAVSLLNAWKALPVPGLAAAVLALAIGLRCLSPAWSAEQVSPWVAVPCAAAVGISCAVLTRIAHRARRAKALD